VTAEELIGVWPEPTRAVGRRARSLILALDPDMSEAVKWGNPCYMFRGRNQFALMRHRAYVNLQIENDAALDDPGGLIEGEGKSMRHVKLKSERDVEQAELMPLLRQALQRLGG